MSARTRRRILDAAITFLVIYTVVDVSGNGWLAIPVFLHGIWNFYDGMTRLELPQ